MNFQKPKGTVDFYPFEMSQMTQVFSNLQNIAKNYGFQQVDTPALETLSLLTAKSGDEIEKQIFTLEKRSKEQLGLRFDLTVPVTRMFIDRQLDLPKPVKWFYTTKMWRYEAPQKGRLREFFQYGVELYGSKEASADAEIINLVIDSLKSFGLTDKDFFIKLNNRKLLEGIVSQFTDDKVIDVIKLIDKKDKISLKEFEKSLTDLGIKDTKKLITILDMSDKPKTVFTKLSKLNLNTLAQEGLDELKQIIPLTDENFIKIDLSCARGLAYYTGTVFECYDIEEKFRAIAGGGRYDNLVKLFGGRDTPAVGFAMGYSTLWLLLDDKMKLPGPDIYVDYYVAPVNEEVYSEALKIAQSLRSKNFMVNIDLTKRSLRKQFDFANSMGAKKVIIVGEKDLKNKQVTLRDMLSGKEEKVLINSL